MQKIPEDEYLTIESSAVDKMVVKGSVFSGQAYPVQSQKQAEEKLKEVKEKYFDATHNCYGYVLEKEICKSSDAGEPRGTAGNQILKAIQTKGLNFVLVVVTRYFGGTKLGTSGLSKAYRNSTLNTLNKCKIVKKITMEKLSFSFPLNFYGGVSRIISRFECQIISTDFQDEVQIQTQVRKGLVEEFKNNLTDSTEGKIRFY